MVQLAGRSPWQPSWKPKGSPVEPHKVKPFLYSTLFERWFKVHGAPRWKCLWRSLCVCDEPWNWISLRVLLFPHSTMTEQGLRHLLHLVHFKFYDRIIQKMMIKMKLFLFFHKTTRSVDPRWENAKWKCKFLQHVFTREHYLKCSRFCRLQHLFLVNHTHTLATRFPSWEIHFLPISPTKRCQRAPQYSAPGEFFP